MAEEEEIEAQAISLGRGMETRSGETSGEPRYPSLALRSGELRLRRERCGLRLSQVAEIVKIPAATLAAWEKGKTPPDRAKVMELLALYQDEATTWEIRVYSAGGSSTVERRSSRPK